MAENNATCSICGNGYHLCLSCRDAIQLAPYKVHCCSADCYKVFQVIRGFSTGVYTEEEFKSKLKNLDLSNLENYREHIKALIKNALKEKPTTKIVKENKSVEIKVVEVEKNAVVKDVVNVEKTDDIVKPTVSRKRNYKVEVE
jgi:hypothetical protein